MPPITDILTLCLAIFLIINGAFRGFLSSLLGPISLILATVIAYVYFNITQNIPVSLAIGLFGPFTIGWILRLLLQVWGKSLSTENHISLLSRFAGAALTFTWGIVLLVITVLLLAMIPPINKPFEFIYKDIHNSKLYQMIKPWDSFAMEKSDVHEDLRSLSQDKRILEIVNDPQILEAVNKKDYPAIMTNPKIVALMQDPQLMKKLLGVYRQMMIEQSGS